MHICCLPFNVRETPSQALTDLYGRVLLAGGMAIPTTDDEVNTVYVCACLIVQYSMCQNIHLAQPCSFLPSIVFIEPPHKRG